MAAYNNDLQVKHIRGQNNKNTDMLSRWKVTNLQIPEVRILKTCYWHEISPEMLLPNFQI